MGLMSQCCSYVTPDGADVTVLCYVTPDGADVTVLQLSVCSGWHCQYVTPDGADQCHSAVAI
jgi:hypothetical protein